MGMGMQGMNMGMMGMQSMMNPMMNQGGSAPKTYHRMVNDFITLKTGFYMSKIRKYTTLLHSLIH